MENVVENKTVRFEILALIGLFIPGSFLDQYYSSGWVTSSFSSYASMMLNKLLLVITILLIVLVIMIQKYRIKGKDKPILYNNNIWLVSVLPLVWFIIASVYNTNLINELIGSENSRVTYSIMFFIEIVVLAMPVIRHSAWAKMGNSGTSKGDSISSFVFGATVFLMVVFVIFNIVEFGGSGHDSSYYMDYNNNGRMDKGEHVYDEFDDGTEGYDYDGDGWND